MFTELLKLLKNLSYINKDMKKFNLTAVVWKEGDQYVSLCPQLDVSSFGDSVDEAVKQLKDAVELYLKDEKVEELPHQKALIKQLVISSA